MIMLRFLTAALALATLASAAACPAWRESHLPDPTCPVARDRDGDCALPAPAAPTAFSISFRD